MVFSVEIYNHNEFIIKCVCMGVKCMLKKKEKKSESFIVL